MKKTLLLLLAAAGAFGPAAVAAADGDSFVWQGLNYNVISEADKTCEVGVNIDVTGDVVIPSTATFNGTDYTVTTLGTDAFYANVGMTTISLPETLTTIRSQALSRCLDLTELVIPNSVTTIETRAAYASYASRLVLSSGLKTIPFEAFSGSRWEEVVIPDGVEEIADDAFNYCAYMERLDLGHTVKSLGKFSFAGCNSLTDVTLPASLTSVGQEAFGYCYRINTVTLEGAATPLTFAPKVFGDPTYAHDYEVMARIATLNLNRDFTCTATDDKDMPFAYKPTLVTVNIGEGVKDLPANAFASSEIIMNVNITATAVPAVKENTFAPVTYTLATLSVPEKQLADYRDNAVWGKFKRIEGVAEPVVRPERPYNLSETGMNLTVGDTFTLTLVPVEDDYSPECTVEWASANEDVVTVAADGTVTAVGPGESTVTATIAVTDGATYTIDCDVKVAKKDEPEIPDSIDTVTVAGTDSGRLFDMAGRPVGTTPRAGLYILMGNDGTVSKIIVK